MLIAAAGLALLAACGTPSAGGTAGSPSAVAYSHCMRSHGVPNWPDPTVDSEGRPVFNHVPVGITHSQTHSPPISNTLVECGRLDPASVGMESS
jgi:hypothetical protein